MENELPEDPDNPNTVATKDSDNEDPVERFETEVEQIVDGFVEEPPVRHNVYPDSSDSDEEDGINVQVRGRDHIRRGNGSLYNTQIFYSGIAFKEAVLDYALRTGRNIKQYRYDKTKLGFDCGMSDGCEWRIYCSLVGKTGKWQVKRFKESHTCIPNGECEMLTVPAIARLFLDKIRAEPEYMMPMKIEEIIKERYKITVTRPQCQAARLKALKLIEEEYDKQFARLRDYRAEILTANPGSTVEVDTLTNDEGEDVFNRFYVCFDNVRRSWKDTCRPIIGVDGCFLRSEMKGQLLSAVGRDVDNSMYPIAWGIVQVENKDNWLWFLKKLKDDLLLEDGEGYILISYRQKGLIYAVGRELPNIEHRMCVRHIYGNLKAKHGKKTQMKPFIWNLSWSYNEAEFEENLDRLRCYDTGVYDDVMKANPRSWCRAFYKIGNCCEDVENNTTESFNSSISKARDKPLVPMLEMIRRLAMERITQRSVKASKHRGICTPYVAECLELEHERAADCKVYRSTNGTFEVDLSGCGYRVNMERKICTCRKWEITGIPCAHAYGVILSKKYQVDDYVSPWFHTGLWRGTYLSSIIPMRGAFFWPKGTGRLVTKPPEPEGDGKKKTKKSKKEKRKKGKNESPLKKKPKQLKRVMHCRVCGQPGHNSRFHKKVSQANGINMGQSQSCE